MDGNLLRVRQAKQVEEARRLLLQAVAQFPLPLR